MGQVVIDNGYKSRKMVMAYVAMVLVLAGFLAGGLWPALQSIFAEYVMGVMGAASIYAGSNIGARWMHLKHERLTQKTAASVKAAPGATAEPEDPLEGAEGPRGTAVPPHEALE